MLSYSWIENVKNGRKQFVMLVNKDNDEVLPDYEQLHADIIAAIDKKRDLVYVLKSRYGNRGVFPLSDFYKKLEEDFAHDFEVAKEFNKKISSMEFLV